jgi:hypothetical protein
MTPELEEGTLMQTIGASCDHSSKLNAFLPQDGYYGATRTRLLSTTSQKSMDIALVTAEGDKVTISAKSALQAGIASYDYRGRLNGNDVSLQGRALQVSSENSFALSVEGDLSQDELDDIQTLMGNLEKLGADFFSRPLEDSLAQVLSVGDGLDSIASFDAHLHFSRQVTMAQEVREETATTNTPPSGEFASSLDKNSNLNTPPPLSPKDVQSFVNKLLKEAQNSQADSEKVADKLPKFLAKLFKRFAKELNFDEPKQRLAHHVCEKVAQGLQDKPEQAPPQVVE